MIPYLKAQVEKLVTLEAQRAIVREYLQMRILQSLQRTGAMIPLAFHGGTALRFLYQLPRYSEDLDFALERKPDQYDLRKYLTAIRQDLTAETYNVEIKLSERKVVHSAFIRFRSLYHQLGISCGGRFNPSAPISRTENMPDFGGSPILPFILLTLNGRKSHHVCHDPQYLQSYHQPHQKQNQTTYKTNNAIAGNGNHLRPAPK